MEAAGLSAADLTMKTTSADYWSMEKAESIGMPFNFIIGGRGTGKTYNLMQYVYKNALADENSHFIYIRRMESEVASIANPRYNPFKAINRDMGTHIEANFSQKFGIGEFVNIEEDEPEVFIGYAAALTTFGKFRGADLCDVSTIVFDEFIKTLTARPIPDEADLFFNAYETIARNRELDGFPPVKAYLLSNSTTLESPLLEELGLVKVIDNMRRKGDSSATIKELGVHIELLKDLPITEKKKNTALYNLTKHTTYFKHAIDNEFAYDSFEGICKVNLNEYIPYIRFKDVYIYQHKSRIELYCCDKPAKCPQEFDGEAVALFKRNYGMRLYQLILYGYVKYSSFAIKSQINSLFTR